jgi:N-dimethylarginine dimethylaminohydrolase
MEGVVLASPEFYDVKYSINPLTNRNSLVNKEKAMEQFERVKSHFIKHKIPVHVLDAKIADPTGKFPDLVFVSNSALILRGWPTKVAILARYANPERRGEEARCAAYLKHILGYKVLSLPEQDGVYYEGQGDSRWSHDGKDLWLCYGADRTTKSGIQALKNIILKEALEANWVPPNIHSLQMVEKKTYHLDLCFLPLPNNRLLLHESSFSAASRKEIRNYFGKENTLHVPLKLLYACNSVWLDKKHLLIPKLAECRQWMYRGSGMKIEEVNVDQFHLAGGSVSCMVLALWKTIDYSR